MHYSSIYSFISGSLLAFYPTVHCQFFHSSSFYSKKNIAIFKLPVFSFSYQSLNSSDGRASDSGSEGPGFEPCLRQQIFLYKVQRDLNGQVSMPLPADSEKSCTWKFSVHSSSYLTKARRIGKTPGRIGILLGKGQQHRIILLWLAQIFLCLSYCPAGIMVISMRSTRVKQFL